MTLRRYGALCAVVLLGVMLLAGVARADVVNVAAKAGLQQDNIRTFSVTPLRSELRPNYGEDPYTQTVNGDLLDDFFLVRHTPDEGVAAIPPSTLWYGTATGTFNEQGIDQFKKSNNNTDKHGCDWGDADNDGDLDLFCAVGLTQTSKNELWIQGAGGSFTERSQEMGLRDYFKGRYRYATFIDVDNDSDLDIYVARYTGSCKCDNNGDGVIDYTGDSWPNELWINNVRTTGKFTFDGNPADPNSSTGQFNLTQVWGAKKDNATCLQNVDYDHDNDEDILFCGQNRMRLLRNDFDGGTGRGFTDVSASKSLLDDVQDARLVFLDNDNLYDLVRLKKKTLQVKMDSNQQSGQFGPWQTLIPALTGGEALAFGFFDNDTTLDIYALSSRQSFKNDQPDHVLLNKATGWETITIAAVIPGSGDDVGAIDYDSDGNDEFLVTNGDRKIAGPLQLFDWQEPTPGS